MRAAVLHDEEKPQRGPKCDSTAEGVRVPGSRASPVKVASLCNSFPRWLTKSSGSLGLFFQSVVNEPYESSSRTSKLAEAENTYKDIWPMPVPFAEVFKSGSFGSSHWKKKVVAMEVVILNWLHLGCPCAAPACARLGVKPSRKQWEVVQYLLHVSLDGNTPELVDVGLMGRAAMKFENVEKALQMISESFSTLHDSFRGYDGGGGERPLSFDDSWLRSAKLMHSIPGHDVMVAKPIVSSRLKFPRPPSFDPVQFFDGPTCELYLRPIDHAEDHSKFHGQVPVVKINAAVQEKLDLYKKLAECGRLRRVDKACDRSPFVSGLFSVGKNEVKDRLILDARPPNLLEQSRTVWCSSMAAGSCLVDIVLQPGRILVSSGLDLTDYFYQFVISPQRVDRNRLAGSLSAYEAKYVFGKNEPADFDGPVLVSLSTLAMGDLLACEFAQAAHLGLCLQNQVCDANSLLSFRTPVPRSLSMIGIVIDDLIALEQIFSEQLAAPPGDLDSEKRIARALAGYEKATLLHNPDKGFTRETCSRFWGCELDGSKGLVRGSTLRMWPLFCLTCRIALLGFSTVKLMEVISGCWISLMTMRRRLLCVMNLIFEPLGIEDSTRVIKLSPELIDELFCICALAPLAVADLKSQFLPFVVATDASSTWMAAVRADLDVKVVEECSRHSLKKGNWSQLLPTAKAWLKSHDMLDPEDEMPEEGYNTHPLWTTLASSLHYVERWRAPCKYGQHINILELKSFIKEEKALARSFCGARYLAGLDSQVSLGALVKGRAASVALNSVLRSSLCYPIGSGLAGYYMYFASETNRADGPTRNASPALPDVDKPAWMQAIADRNSYVEFDEWMKKAERGVVQAPYNCDDLMNGTELDCRPRRRVGRSDRRRVDRPPEKKAVRELKADEDNGRPPVEQRIQKSSADKENEHLSELSVEAIEALKKIPKQQFFFGVAEEKAFKFKGALDLYSGSFGIARQMISNGAPWVLTYEWKRSSRENLLDGDLQSFIFLMVSLGCFLAISMAPICASFSMAVTPPVRTLRYPRGRPGLSAAMRLKVKEGNLHLEFTMKLVDMAEGQDIGYFVENPDGSWFWRQSLTRRFRDPSSPLTFRFSFCRFGTAWQKNTRIATSTRLRGVRMLCTCGAPHHQLRGYSRVHKKSWTAVAEPYPRGLCRLLSIALCAKAGWCDQRRLNVAGCARLKNLRPGEAQNPGPARRRGQSLPTRNTLEELPGILPNTLMMESKLLREFLRWCESSLRSTSPSLVFDRVPGFLGAALRSYGDLSFQNHGSLANFRHLILACQRWKPGCRPYTATAWELVKRWEIQEPVTHRPPTPESVVLAMCSVAWNHGWYEWVGVTLISFYGAGRLGETIRCRRADLIMPADTCEDGVNAIFLQLRTFKSMFRQPARIQHMKVSNNVAVKVISRIYLNYGPLDKLFAGSHSQYRRRWDFLLQVFQISSKLRLTPGGLRGGSAVAAYRAGRSIVDIQWSLRLRSISTLESYLQETGTLTVFMEFSALTRSLLRDAAKFFRFLAG